MNKDSVIFVAGHRGLVGSNIVRSLKERGFSRVLTENRTSLDLLDQQAVRRFFQTHEIEYVFLAAAKVGGILYNQRYQADFLYENLMISANVIHAAAESNVEKLLYLGSSCIYPREAEQPIREESLLSGPLEPTNEGYALAKIVGLKLCEKYREQYGKSFISAMPTNLYGPGDSFHPEHSHVIPGLMRRFHEAKMQEAPVVKVWGTGSPKREFLHVKDLAEGLLVLMDQYNGSSTINIGTGVDISIRDLAEMIREVVGFEGKIAWDTSKPDGTPRKVLEVSKIRELGWTAETPLLQGLRDTYLWATQHGILESSPMHIESHPEN